MDDKLGKDFSDLIEELARKIAVPEGHAVYPVKEYEGLKSEVKKLHDENNGLARKLAEAQTAADQHRKAYETLNAEYTRICSKYSGFESTVRSMKWQERKEKIVNGSKKLFSSSFAKYAGIAALVGGGLALGPGYTAMSIEDLRLMLGGGPEARLIKFMIGAVNFFSGIGMLAIPYLSAEPLYEKWKLRERGYRSTILPPLPEDWSNHVDLHDICKPVGSVLAMGLTVTTISLIPHIHDLAPWHAFMLPLTCIAGIAGVYAGKAVAKGLETLIESIQR